MAQNININKTLNAIQVPKDVYNAIRKAANATGVNFSYLMEKAAVESGFDKNAKARTSSATGLFQFIESTWLRMVKDHGAKYGLEKYAGKISEDGRVATKKDRNEILALRKDPEVASLMAAEFATDNYNTLSERVGGEIGSTELYMAHFLGAGGASAFLNAMKKSPNMTAADIFPKEARANRNVFFDSKTGQARSMSQVYAFFDKKFDDRTSGAPVRTIALNATPLRTQGYTGPRSANPENFASMGTDPLARITALMDTMQAQESVLRITDSNPSENFQVFPSSLYNKLALSPAQMMMLSDFTA